MNVVTGDAVVAFSAEISIRTPIVLKLNGKIPAYENVRLKSPESKVHLSE